MARAGLDENRKFKRLARALDAVSGGMGDVFARGVLETLWSSAYERADDWIGDADDVEIAARWRGTRGALFDALLHPGGLDVGFIEPDPDRGGYRVHDFWTHAPPWVKEKAQREAIRKAAGKSLSEQRAEAGRIGRAKQLQATTGQPVEQLPEEPGQPHGQEPDACRANPSPGLGRAGQGREKGVPVVRVAPVRDLLVDQCRQLVSSSDRGGAMGGDLLAPALAELVRREAPTAAAPLDQPAAYAAKACEAFAAIRASCTPSKLPDWRADALRLHWGRVARLVAETEAWPRPWAPTTSAGGARETPRIRADGTAQPLAAEWVEGDQL